MTRVRLLSCDVELLERALELVRAGWCQYAFARNGAREPCAPADAGAVRFDAYGAIMRAAAELAPSRVEVSWAISHAQKAAAFASPSACDGLVAWNDVPWRTHAEVLDMLARAVTFAREARRQSA